MLNRIAPSRCKGKFSDNYLTSSDWVAEPKLDGGRYMLYIEMDGETIHLYSRRDFPRIDKAANVPHFARPYPGLAGVILDGEVINERAVRGGFKPLALGETTGIMNSLPAKAIARQKVEGLLFYCVFDILAINGVDVHTKPLKERRALLKAVVEHMSQTTDTVLLVPQFDDKDALFNSMLTAGLEGVVLKNVNSAYGVNWVKMKRCADFSVIISGYKPGQGKYTNTLGAVAVSVYQSFRASTHVYCNTCAAQLSPGQEHSCLVEVGFASGMTDAERDDIWKNQDAYLGRVIDITAQEVTKDGRLRHPRWLRFRDDVEASTCTMDKLLSDAKEARRG